MWCAHQCAAIASLGKCALSNPPVDLVVALESLTAIGSRANSSAEQLQPLATVLGLPLSVLERPQQTRVGLPSGPKTTLYSSRSDIMMRRLVVREMEGDLYGLSRLPTHLGERALMLDIGSHVGATAILLALRHPELRVHAFEPDATTFLFLVWNLLEHRLLGRVTPHHLALHSDNTGLEFVTSGDDTTSSRAVRMGRPWGSQQAKTCVPTIQLGAFLDVTACDVHARVQLVKLDCEGCEYDIVPQNTTFFEKHVRYLFGEVHEWQLRGRGVTLSNSRFSETHRLLCARSQKTTSDTTNRFAALCCPQGTSAMRCVSE